MTDEPASSAGSHARPGWRFVQTLAAGVTLAVGAALFEVVYRMLGRPLSPRLPDTSLHSFWFVPAGTLLLAAPIIGVTALARAAWPEVATVSRVIFVQAILPVFALSQLVFRESLHDLAHLILALGIASVLARVVARRSDPWLRAFTVACPLLVAVPLGVLIWATQVQPRIEAATVRALPAAPDRAKNVLLIVWDTVRAANLSLYGHDVETTPRLRSLTANAVVFNRAYATAPWTLPSHATMFTGRPMQEINADWTTALDAEFPVVSEVLAGEGYRTGGFTANVLATMPASGLDRGFQHYEERTVELGSANLINSLNLAHVLRRYPPFRGHWHFRPFTKDAAVVTDRFLRWFDVAGSTRPFFAFLNYFNAHEVYHFPESYRQRFDTTELEGRYDAAIAYQDAELDRLFRALADRDALDDTVVILTSDHGEAFGERDLFGHGGNLFVEQLHVPLVIWPGETLTEGRTIDTPVSLRDLAATMMDLALGRSAAPLAGTSLAPVWMRGTQPAERLVVSGVHQNSSPTEEWPIRRGAMSAAIRGPYHLILHAEDGAQLYDLVRDPLEVTDLANDPSMQTLLTDLRDDLLAVLPPEWVGLLHPRGQPVARATPQSPEGSRR